MPRSHTSLLLAAAVATVAALGVGGAADLLPTASAADSTRRAPEVTTDLAPGAATPDLAPRVIGPARELRAAEAPADPAPDPAPEPAPEQTPSSASRQLRGTGLLRAATGTSSDPVDTGGSTVRFSVEVEDGTGLDPAAVAAQVEEALYDHRSWARDYDLRRVAPDQASIHVVIASPASVDALCRRAGLNTAGWLSCWNGRVAAINLDRWNLGVSHVDDLAQYRRYVVNHEVGHGLGFDHRGCPGSGRLSPLMAQQTKSLDGCIANEWRHPDA